MQFLDPKTDIAFKKLFGDEHRKNLTISFLNSILERKEGNLITDITFQDTANFPETIDKKRSFVDVNCIDQAKNNYIVEMSSYAKASADRHIEGLNGGSAEVLTKADCQSHFLPRSQYYASLVLSRQLKVRAHYGKLVPVIFVAVVNHILFKNHNNVISHHLITDTKTHEVQLQHLEFHYVELPKFTKKVDQLKTTAEKWFYFMQQAENLDVIPQSLQHKEFQEAFHVLESSQWNQDELDNYIVEMDELGREERITEGALERGLEKGREKVAMSLLKEGMTIEFVVKVTNLTVDQVEMLYKTLSKS